MKKRYFIFYTQVNVGQAFLPQVTGLYADGMPKADEVANAVCHQYNQMAGAAVASRAIITGFNEVEEDDYHAFFGTTPEQMTEAPIADAEGVEEAKVVAAKPHRAKKKKPLPNKH